MKRLIDANALKENIRKNYVICTVGHYFDDLFQDFYNAIDEQPTVDAEPVRHGKWIKADSQQYFRKHYPCFTCSVCGYRKDSQKKWNYCPNCGCRMDAE